MKLAVICHWWLHCDLLIFILPYSMKCEGDCSVLALPVSGTKPTMSCTCIASATCQSRWRIWSWLVRSINTWLYSMVSDDGCRRGHRSMWCTGHKDADARSGWSDGMVVACGHCRWAHWYDACTGGCSWMGTDTLVRVLCPACGLHNYDGLWRS